MPTDSTSCGLYCTRNGVVSWSAKRHWEADPLLPDMGTSRCLIVIPHFSNLKRRPYFHFRNKPAEEEERCRKLPQWNQSQKDLFAKYTAIWCSWKPLFPACSDYLLEYLKESIFCWSFWQNCGVSSLNKFNAENHTW